MCIRDRCKIKNKQILTLWGTGKPKRELMYADDLADACIYFLNKKSKETLINVGSGKEMQIIGYAKFIIRELKLDLKIKLDRSKPDGTPRKIIDSSLARKCGWKPNVDLKEGFKKTYADYLKKSKFRWKNILYLLDVARLMVSDLIKKFYFVHEGASLTLKG